MACTTPNNNVSSTSTEDVLFVPLQRRNTTSTLYMDHILESPDADVTMECFAITLHRVIQRNSSKNNNDNNEEYDNNGDDDKGTSIACHYGQLKRIFDERLYPLGDDDIELRRKPSYCHVYQFIQTLHLRQDLPEVLILACALIDRFVLMSGLSMTWYNWRRIVLGGMLIAYKLYEDQNVLNSSFCLPYLSILNLNALERSFLILLNYNLTLSPTLYAKYYFGLRCAVGSIVCPDMPLDLRLVKKARKLEEDEIDQRRRRQRQHQMKTRKGEAGAQGDPGERGNRAGGDRGLVNNKNYNDNKSGGYSCKISSKFSDVVFVRCRVGCTTEVNNKNNNNISVSRSNSSSNSSSSSSSTSNSSSNSSSSSKSSSSSSSSSRSSATSRRSDNNSSSSNSSNSTSTSTSYKSNTNNSTSTSTTVNHNLKRSKSLKRKNNNITEILKLCSLEEFLEALRPRRL